VVWWQTLLVAVAGGTLTLIGTTLVGLINRRATNRAEWFRRVQWAQQLTVSDNDQVQAAGYNALEALAGSTLATRDDLHLLEHLSYSPRLAQVPDEHVDTTRYVVDTGGSSDETGEA
jgi:hypothetical protein